MKQVRLKLVILEEKDLAAYFINWDATLKEEWEQIEGDVWLSTGVYDLDDKNDRIARSLVERFTTNFLHRHKITFKINNTSYGEIESV